MASASASSEIRRWECPSFVISPIVANTMDVANEYRLYYTAGFYRLQPAYVMMRMYVKR